MRAVWRTSLVTQKWSTVDVCGRRTFSGAMLPATKAALLTILAGNKRGRLWHSAITDPLSLTQHEVLVNFKSGSACFQSRPPARESYDRLVCHDDSTCSVTFGRDGDARPDFYAFP